MRGKAASQTTMLTADQLILQRQLLKSLGPPIRSARRSSTL